MTKPPVPAAKEERLIGAKISIKLVVEELSLPAASKDIALTLIVPSPKVLMSLMLSVTAWAEPVPASVLVTVLPPLVKVTTVVASESVKTVITPEVAVAWTAVAPPDNPESSSKTGIAGAEVSSVKLVVAAEPILPAALVATALTLMVPSPKVVSSFALSVTACVDPLLVSDVETLPLVPVKVTAMLVPVSPVTVTTPVLAVASAAVAPPDTPLPRVRDGAVGAERSSVKLVVAAEPVLPAASVATALMLMVPLVNWLRSFALSVTA